MKAGRLLAAIMLVLLLCSAALADDPAVATLTGAGTWSTLDEGSNPVFVWSLDCFVDCAMVLDVEFSGIPGGGNYFKLYGPQDEDPIVTQTTKNNSGNTWLDWHVDIQNGIIDRTAGQTVVKKVATGADAANWDIQYIHNAGYTDGFGAKWVGGNTSVAGGQSLSIKFKWTPDGSGLPVTIRQYPTDSGTFIPEPSSVMAFSGGLVSLGFAFIRRRK